MKKITNNQKKLFPRTSCLIMAEVAQAHDGSLGMAHAYIDAAAEAGADAIKFQTHIAAAESTLAEPWRVKFSYQDATRYDYWKRMEFSEEQWKGLALHAQERGLLFLSSPFSLEAVELLLRVGVPAWKIASGEVSNTQLFDRLVQTGLPVLLSTGMSSIEEIDGIVQKIKQACLPFVIMQCHSSYPCPPEKVGLNMIPAFQKQYQCSVGLSDHSGTIFPGLAAVMLGIEALEVHLTFSRQMFGPDVPASITTSELKQMVEGIRFIEKMLAHQVDKDRMADELRPMRRLFTKSVVARTDLPAGTIIDRAHLALKKPGSGLPPDQLDKLIGKRLLRDLLPDEQIGDNDYM